MDIANKMPETVVVLALDGLSCATQYNQSYLCRTAPKRQVVTVACVLAANFAGVNEP